MTNQEQEPTKVSRKDFLKIAGIGAGAGIAGLAALEGSFFLGRIFERREAREAEEEPTATFTLEATSIPTETVLKLTETPTPTRTTTPTATPAETAIPTATATILLSPTPESTPTRDTRANLCARESFIVPDQWWTGRARNGEEQLRAEDVVRFLNAPPEAPAKEALLQYLEENGKGKFMPIKLIPETVRAEDIPLRGAVDVMADLDLKGFMQGLDQILKMGEEAYVDASEGQLEFEEGNLIGLEEMLYRKRVTENGQAKITVRANWQTIKVTREMMSACYERWDNSPIALIEGQDQDGSRLIMAFDGYCGNLFLAIKFPSPTPTVVPPTETPGRKRETPTPHETPPTATAVPPQEAIPTPTKGIPTATAVPPQEAIDTPTGGNQ